ncbi:hypothetical protein DB346_12035 [Verrucomicrobia bacterium LW23]|nr:hypothetical protein DB346_12035 [Verrucomicrobia bacterium LW23]
MDRKNEILIKAPLADVFSVASDLANWPSFLSHYRYNKFLSRMPWGGVVKMCSTRTGIVTTWVSVFRSDPEHQQLHFEHLNSCWDATKGMKVTWTFTDRGEDGVHIVIHHVHTLNWPIIGSFVADWIIGWFFISHIANKTLHGLKKRMEARK